LSPVILDASAGVEIAMRTLSGRRLLNVLAEAGSPAVAPEHFLVEAAGVLRRLEGHGSVTRERAHTALSRLATLVDTAEVGPLLEEAWGLRANLTIADAVYVVLARRLDAPLLTLDSRLAGAPNLGIRILGPI
jgi:predicted nucleic acid-binding protein